MDRRIKSWIDGDKIGWFWDMEGWRGDLMDEWVEEYERVHGRMKSLTDGD